MADKKRVLMIYPRRSSFVKRDIDILSERYEVSELLYTGREDLFTLSSLVRKTDVNISWFVLGYATGAAFLSRLLGRKSILIAGGWDVVSMPEIGYGAMEGTRVKRTGRALREADRVIAVSDSTREWVLKWVKRNDVTTLHHGFDSHRFAPRGDKEEMVLTVGDFRNDVTVRVKGLDIYIRTAESMPQVKFVIIGEHEQNTLRKWTRNAPENLDILGYLPEDELIGYYGRARVYAQLSYQESFGCALAEAMLCECVPVTSDRGALPEVVGDSGYVVKYGEVDAVKDSIEKALASDKGPGARNRIVAEFPLDKRRRGLFEIMDECLAGK